VGALQNLAAIRLFAGTYTVFATKATSRLEQFFWRAASTKELVRFKKELDAEA
jgi:hypothetical protein